MFDHVSLSVTDPARSRAFYAKALAPLAYKIISQNEDGFGIGAEDGSALWVAGGPAQKPIAHLAFRTKERKQVDAFHRAALAAGGKDNGKPGLRELCTDVLRGVRPGPGRQQYRGGVPRAGMTPGLLLVWSGAQRCQIRRGWSDRGKRDRHDPSAGRYLTARKPSVSGNGSGTITVAPSCR